MLNFTKLILAIFKIASEGKTAYKKVVGNWGSNNLIPIF